MHLSSTLHSSAMQEPMLTLGVMIITLQWRPHWAEEDLQAVAYSVFTGPGREAGRDTFPIFLDFPSLFSF